MPPKASKLSPRNASPSGGIDEKESIVKNPKEKTGESCENNFENNSESRQSAKAPGGTSARQALALVVGCGDHVCDHIDSYRGRNS